MIIGIIKHIVKFERLNYNLSSASYFKIQEREGGRERERERERGREREYVADLMINQAIHHNCDDQFEGDDSM